MVLWCLLIVNHILEPIKAGTDLGKYLILEN